MLHFYEHFVSFFLSKFIFLIFAVQSTASIVIVFRLFPLKNSDSDQCQYQTACLSPFPGCLFDSKHS